MNKIRMLSDVVAEVRKEAPEDVPNWSKRYEEAKQNLQNQITKGRILPKIEVHPLENLAFNYSVQRDVRAGHVMNIMRKFDPRVCGVVSAVRLSSGPTLYIFDGQHRAVALALLGEKEIQVAVVDTDEPAFDAEAFEIVNDSGILGQAQKRYTDVYCTDTRWVKQRRRGWPRHTWYRKYLTVWA
jgi:hypothetical protein